MSFFDEWNKSMEEMADDVSNVRYTSIREDSIYKVIGGYLFEFRGETYWTSEGDEVFSPASHVGKRMMVRSLICGEAKPVTP